MSPAHSTDDTSYRLFQVLPTTRVSSCAEISLKLLADETDQRPLCLHTIPPPGTAIKDIEEIISQSKVNPDKNAVGRVISIVEMIKRDFAASDRAKKLNEADSNKNETSQLHQYNEYGSLESLILERSKGSDLSESERRAQVIAHQDKVLKEFLDEERKRPRQTHTPWLKVYISKTRISALEKTPNVFYQEPLINPPPPSNLQTLESDTLRSISIQQEGAIESEIALV